MTQGSQTQRKIDVKSDWITTLAMALLLVLCGLLLTREIDRSIWGHLERPSHPHIGFWSIYNRVLIGFAAILCVPYASAFQSRSVKLAFALAGIRLAVFDLLSCFNISSSVSHIAAVAGSAVSQVALAIFCVAIAQWFRTVVHWNPPSESLGDSH
jgi:hypothetical protein